MSADLKAANSIFDQQFSSRKQELSCFIEIGIEQAKISYFHSATNQYIGFSKFDLNSNNNWAVANKKLEKQLVTIDFSQFKAVNVSISDALYSIVPAPLFDDKKLEEYIKFNHELDNAVQYKFYTKKIESQQAYVVFAIPRSLAFMLMAKLPPHQITHFAEPLLEAVGAKKWSKNQLKVHIQHERLDIIYNPENKLTFFNSFQYKSTEDFIYFLLYVMEQLGLEREQTELTLWGEFEEQSAIYEMLYKYIQTVNVGDRTKNVSFSTLLNELPKQYHFSLFNQHLCE